METTNTLATKDINTGLIQSYLDYLLQKYKDLEQEEFSNRARLAVRKEIELMRSIMEEQSMDQTWRNLAKTFGIEHKPSARETLTEPDFTESESFKSKFQRDLSEEIF